MSDSPHADAAMLVRAALGAERGARVGLDSAAVAPGRAVAGWSDDELLAGLVSLEGLVRQVDVWRMALAVEVDERSARGRGVEGLARSRGCRNSRELIRRVTGAAQVSVARWLRLGRATHEATGLTGQPLPATFPAVAAAVAQGRINGDAALSIVDNLNPVRRVAGDAAVSVAEDELVAACAATEPGGTPPIDADSVRIQASTWAQFLDQDGGAPPELDLAHRSLRLGGLHHGLVRVNGLLLPEVASALRAFADACTNPRTGDVPVPGGAEPGSSVVDGTVAGLARPGGAGLDVDGPAGGLPACDTPADASDEAADPSDESALADTRTSSQMLHDVLAMALNAAGRVADQRSVAGNSPTVLVAVREADLEQRRGTGVVFTGDSFGGRVPLSMEAIRQLACSGAVQRVALNDAGAVVGLWSAERCFTGQQRRAIALRDGGCVIPGCHVPAGWCEVHHVTPHAQDPDGTHTDNGTLLCWFHHRTIETSGWEIRMRGGVPEVRPPAWLRALTRNGPPGESTSDDLGGDAYAGAGASTTSGAHARTSMRAGANPGTSTKTSPNADAGAGGWRRATGSPTRMLDALANRAPRFSRLTG
ncbi:MAG: DUF222 domain-containing protein [Brevundimonas sp.]